MGVGNGRGMTNVEGSQERDTTAGVPMVCGPRLRFCDSKSLSPAAPMLIKLRVGTKSEHGLRSGHEPRHASLDILTFSAFQTQLRTLRRTIISCDTGGTKQRSKYCTRWFVTNSLTNTSAAMLSQHRESPLQSTPTREPICH